MRLTQGRIYILPTRAGAVLAVTLILMLLGCINYNLGLGYVLTFLLTGVARGLDAAYLPQFGRAAVASRSRRVRIRRRYLRLPGTDP